MTNTAAAETILQQLGGRRFCVMTGAKAFLAGDTNGQPFLMFTLPARAKDGSNKVRITLTAMDDYFVETFFIRGVTVKPCSFREGVYCDTLAPVFETITGLRTSL